MIEVSEGVSESKMSISLAASKKASIGKNVRIFQYESTLIRAILFGNRKGLSALFI